jgi:hypothetical protein
VTDKLYSYSQNSPPPRDPDVVVIVHRLGNP